jgi:shikimate dehydrogenase
VGIIGSPVGHSLSPRMHNAAFAELGLNFVYIPLAVQPDGLATAVRGLVALGFAGANVTVPYKSAVLPLLDRLSPVAEAIGAANTLLVERDGSISGHNTDASGFVAALREAGWPDDSTEHRALVVGAGGAARAVAYGLQHICSEVWIANRSFETALALCAALGGVPTQDGETPNAALSAHHYPDELVALAPDADLIVNTTSLGLKADDPLPWAAGVPFRRGQLVCDLVPRSKAAGLTPFLSLAASQGASVLDGRGMLVHQGAKAFELWCGVEAPLSAMWKAVE